MRRLGFVGAAALVAVATLAGCHVGAPSRNGAGEAIDVCTGYRQYNALPAPDTGDAPAILAFVDAADRIFGRIDTTQSYTNGSGHHAVPPADVVAELAAVRTAYRQLRAAVAAVAATPTALHAQMQGFASSSTFLAADTGLELWLGSNCG